MAKIYLTNKDLYKEILISKNIGQLTKEAEKMLVILGKNTIRKFSYKDPDDRMDCLQEGMLDLFKNWRTFDEERFDNAFAFYTEVFKRAAAKSFNRLYQKNRTTGEYRNTIQLSSIYKDGDINI
jgi:DNA-directed RNA polymerase specialized sigma subunit